MIIYTLYFVHNSLANFVFVIDNFPPNITAITEVSDTDSLQENRILYLELGKTYQYSIEAMDANDDEIMYSLPNDGLGAVIDQSKCQNNPEI